MLRSRQDSLTYGSSAEMKCLPKAELQKRAEALRKAGLGRAAATVRSEIEKRQE